jgi:hypothetical protein
MKAGGIRLLLRPLRFSFWDKIHARIRFAGFCHAPWSEPMDQMQAAIKEAEDLFAATAAWFHRHNPDAECTLNSFTSEDVIRLEKIWEYVIAPRASLSAAANEGLTVGRVIDVDVVRDFLQAMGMIEWNGTAWEPVWRRGLSRH